MTKNQLVRAAVFCVSLLGLATGCGDRPSAPAAPLATPADLATHTNEFRRVIETVRPGVWVAIGYGLANSILIEGDDGLIVIDTMASMESGRQVAREFRALTDKPLRAIIYTHNHADHVFGAQAFIEELAVDDFPVEVYAHETTEALVYRMVNVFRPILTARSFRMFGTHLDEAGLVNAGIGKQLEVRSDSAFGFVPPTQTFSDQLKIATAGISLQLIHAPGETDDQLFAWFPEMGLLTPGDNLYKTFPNLYTIRGTPYRSLKDWSRSLDRMRALPVEFLVPSHTRPVTGAKAINRTLTDYRDAISFVHDQTIRRINQGMTPDQIVQTVRLPEHLAQSPFLKEFYGTVAWSARSVMTGNLGWFDGNPATLQPLSPTARAGQMASLAGGLVPLRDAAVAALQAGDTQWALELSDYLLTLDRDDQTAIDLRVAALEQLGGKASNPNARHYYLSSALEFRDGLRFEPLNKPTDEMLTTIPLSNLFEALPVNLRAEACLDKHQRVGFSFNDNPEHWTIVIRRGIAEVMPELADDLDIQVRSDSLAFKKLLAGTGQPLATLLLDFDFPVGNSIQFASFMNLFRAGNSAPEPAPLAAPP
ncbi:MAG: MBL fold metallo-hydrolase [Gammaproteobacteria bacterium]|nr:MBL fold metallo-hydrolase [Gammaproteobacteria bacterium]